MVPLLTDPLRQRADDQHDRNDHGEAGDYADQDAERRRFGHQISASGGFGGGLSYST
jgi:hypothetical protein